MNKNFSCPLFRENLKRFWGFGAVVFMAYFLSTNFPVISQGYKITSYDVKQLVSLNSPGYIAFNVIAPIVSAVIIFSYLSKVNSTTVMHTMPFSRKSLFVTNYISGLALVVIPLILNTIITIVLKYTFIENYAVIVGSDGNVKNILTLSAILWIFAWNFLSILFTYSVSVLAGIISGNSIIHLLTAGAMNFVFPVLYLVCQGYADIFLYGYTESDSMWKVVSYMHPVFQGINNSVSYLFGTKSHSVAIKPVTWIYFFVICIVLTILAFVLYKKRKLEKAGDSYVFDFIKYIIAFIFVFVPATGMGFILADSIGLWAGLAIGGVVGFIIGWMIISKSFKIINLRSICTFLGCAVVSVAIVCGFKFDVFGYEKKIPKLNDIKSVSYNSSYVGNTYWDDEVTKEENIKNLMQVHQNIIDAKEDANADEQSFALTYNLKNGSTLERRYYDVPSALLLSSKELKAVYESDETNKYATEFLLFDSEKMEVSITSDFFDYGDYAYDVVNGNAALKKELLEALIKDLSERTYDKAVSHKVPFLYVSFNQNIGLNEYDEQKYSNVNHYVNVYGLGDGGYNMNSTIQINSNYENFMSVLKKHNIYDKVMPGSDFGFMYITPYVEYDDSYFPGGYVDTKRFEPETYNGVTAPESKKGLVVVSDSDMQRAISENAAYQYFYNIDEKDRYYVNYMAWDLSIIDVEGMPMEPKFQKGGFAYERASFVIDYSKLPKTVQMEINQYL